MTDPSFLDQVDRYVSEFLQRDGHDPDSISPIFMMDSAACQRFVVAIHTTGDFINHGIRITAEVFDQIDAWLK